MQNKRKIGKLITFEGIDGCGKSTQISKLKTFFKNSSDNVIFTREPGGIPEAEEIRKHFLKNSKIDFLKETEILLLLSARNEHYNKLIKPALDRGKIVICDRFADSTLAYQCYSDEKLELFYKKIHKILFKDFKPTLTILMDISPKIASNRLSLRSKKNSFDMKGLNYFNQVRKKYLSIAKDNKRIKTLKAEKSIDKLFKEIIDSIKEI